MMSPDVPGLSRLHPSPRRRGPSGSRTSDIREKNYGGRQGKFGFRRIVLSTSSQGALAHEFPFDLDRAYCSVPAGCDLERHAPLFAPIPLLAASDAPLAFVLGREATYTRRATGSRNSYFSLSGFQKRRKRNGGGLVLLGC